MGELVAGEEQQSGHRQVGHLTGAQEKEQRADSKSNDSDSELWMVRSGV